MKYKKCAKCLNKKLIKEYGNDSKTKDGLRTYCKLCNNLEADKYYLEHKVNRAAARQRNRKFVYEFLQTQQCIDCGDKRWQVLEFDHVRGIKKCNISSMLSGSWGIETIKKEMDKCDIRCANCHRLKTSEQLDFFKADWENSLKITYNITKNITSYRGEKHLSAKLTEKEVLAIREEYATGTTSHSKLSKKYNVSDSVIQSILVRRTWKHI